MEDLTADHLKAYEIEYVRLFIKQVKKLFNTDKENDILRRESLG